METSVASQVDEKIKSLVLVYTYKQGRKKFSNLYSVNLSSPCKIGSYEEGYTLNSYTDNMPSNTVISLTNILYVLRGEVVKIGDNISVQGLKTL